MSAGIAPCNLSLGAGSLLWNYSPVPDTSCYETGLNCWNASALDPYWPGLQSTTVMFNPESLDASITLESFSGTAIYFCTTSREWATLVIELTHADGTITYSNKTQLGGLNNVCSYAGGSVVATYADGLPYGEYRAALQFGPGPPSSSGSGSNAYTFFGGVVTLGAEVGSSGSLDETAIAFGNDAPGVTFSVPSGAVTSGSPPNVDLAWGNSSVDMTITGASMFYVTGYPPVYSYSIGTVNGIDSISNTLGNPSLNSQTGQTIIYFDGGLDPSQSYSYSFIASSNALSLNAINLTMFTSASQDLNTSARRGRASTDKLKRGAGV